MTQENMMKTERFVGLFLVAFLLGFSPGAGTALAGETDDRWLAFSGCWKPVKETTGSEASGALLCFRPGIEDVGVQNFKRVCGSINRSAEPQAADGEQKINEKNNLFGSFTFVTVYI